MTADTPMTITITGRRWLRIATIMLGLAVIGAVNAEPVRAQSPLSCLTATACVPLTLTANVQLTNAHPDVTHALVRCSVKIVSTGLTGTLNGDSAKKALTNRAITDTFTVGFNVVKYAIADSPNHSVTANCDLLLARNGGNTASDITPAVASAVQPVGSSVVGNWAVVASGSTVKWTQEVTFPNVGVP